MSGSTVTIKLNTVLTRAENDYGWHFLSFKAAAVSRLKFEDKKSRRVVCTLNGRHTFQCALLPMSGGFCIIVNKKIRDKLGIIDGDKVTIELTRDDSKYGLPMPKELKEVLRQDREGNRIFHDLTPGKQRTIIYYISKPKDIDRRIHYALTIVEHLKKNEGKIVYEVLAEELKRPAF